MLSKTPLSIFADKRNDVLYAFELIFIIPELCIIIANFVSLIRFLISSVRAPHLSIKSLFIWSIS